MLKDGQNLSRRELLRVAGIAGVGSLLSGGRTTGAELEQPTTRPAEKTKVPTGPFGKTGVEVPMLALGGIFDIPKNQLVLRQAVQWGVTYWDTAYSYGGGNSERGIGMYFQEHPEDRKKIFLVSKAKKHDPEGMSENLQTSLERLKTDYIDMYFLHSVKRASRMAQRAEQWRAWAEQAKAEGKIKLFGFSTHSNMDECLMAASKLDFIDGIMLKYDFRLMNKPRMREAVKACAEKGIGLTAMKTQGGRPRDDENEMDLKLVQHFVEKGFTSRQANLKAVWETKEIASICSQMPNLSILQSNYLAAMDRTPLTAADKRLMSEYALATCSGYCAGCSNICESATGLPVADVMRYLMYRNQYGEVERARGEFAALPAGVRNRLARADYSLAERRCPQRMKIGKLMRQAGKQLA